MLQHRGLPVSPPTFAQRRRTEFYDNVRCMILSLYTYKRSVTFSGILGRLSLFATSITWTIGWYFVTALCRCFSTSLSFGISVAWASEIDGCGSPLFGSSKWFLHCTVYKIAVREKVKRVGRAGSWSKTVSALYRQLEHMIT